jgi:conjugative relaxase-like TrwC/TraI family protein
MRKRRGCAFRELETFAATRVRKQGSQRDRPTGNLVAAAFVHDSSRALDPQLHTHFTVFNATFDETEKCWKALQARGMYDAIRYGTAVYRNELAKRVQQIGYRIQPAKHGFEIEGVSDEVKRFSKRAQQRDAVVQEMEQKLGRKLSNDEISHAVHQSRAKKSKASQPLKSANGSGRNCPPMNGNRCKHSARRLVHRACRALRWWKIRF